MTRQRIDVDGKWLIDVYYNVDTPKLNQGFAYTDFKKRKSIIAIGKTSSKYQFYNTVVHEAKHV